MHIYNNILKAISSGQRLLSILLDPDHADLSHIFKCIDTSIEANADYFFLGGSLLDRNNSTEIIKYVHQNSKIPCVIFPGSNLQLNSHADALLLPSLISGRNPDLLIGRHVESAMLIKSSQIETIPIGYMLIDSGKATTVNYMSNTQPIPFDNTQIAVATATAGELLGLKMIYLEAGSGANRSVSETMTKAVRQNTSIPLIVGGGIKTGHGAKAIIAAGADMIVVGNAVEADPSLVFDLSLAVHSTHTKPVL